MFKNKVAVITGGSRGIGFAVAERLVAGGAQVIITGRKPDSLDAAVAQLGERARGVAGKLGDESHLEDLKRVIENDVGGVDLLVNNVGMNPVFGDMVTLELAAARKIFETNVLGALRVSTQLLSLGLKDRSGAIVNVSSLAGVQPTPGIGLYGVSKAALIALTKQMALEFAPEVRVNAVAPAAVKTQFAAAMYEGREAELAERYPLKRIGQPEDVAGPVAFFLSDAAGWVTGQTLLIDGGITLVNAE